MRACVCGLADWIKWVVRDNDGPLAIPAKLLIIHTQKLPYSPSPNSQTPLQISICPFHPVIRNWFTNPNPVPEPF